MTAPLTVRRPCFEAWERRRVTTIVPQHVSSRPARATHHSSPMTLTRAPTVVVVQTIVPDYRERFFDELATRIGPGFRLLAGAEDWESGIAASDRVTRSSVRNVFVVRRHLLWQGGVVRPAVAADVAVLGLNPRVLTTWLALVLRRVRRRRTVLWGHAWPRGGRSSKTDGLRSLMRRLADAMVVYTESEAAEMRRVSPRLDVVAAPNALYRRDELQPASSEERPTDIVCVGRLAASKRPRLLLDAFAAAMPELPPDVRLVLVGDGPLRRSLEERARGLDEPDRVRFAGHVSALERLREIYERAIASVAAGEVGLSLVQSLGFGIPMILSPSSRHGPEIEAAREGANVVHFDPGTTDELARAIVSTVRERDEWRARRDAISADVQERYSVEAMVDAFLRALRDDARTRPPATATLGKQRA